MPRGRTGELLKVEVGDRFGRLVVESFLNVQGRCNRYLLKCDCGRETKTIAQRLLTGITQSCGKCVRRGALPLYLIKDPTYRSWRSMRNRCYNPSLPDYRNYGARGITVCDRWRDSFENFLADVGPRPGSEFSIDRYPNNDGNYEPGNVRWATKKQQGNNRRGNHLITHDGRTSTVAEWADILNIPYRGLLYLIRVLGLSLADAILRIRNGAPPLKRKVSDEQVRAIRSDPRPHSQIARQFGISQSHVSRIKSRKVRSDVC